MYVVVYSSCTILLHDQTFRGTAFKATICVQMDEHRDKNCACVKCSCGDLVGKVIIAIVHE